MNVLAEISQTGRTARFISPFGDDTLVLTGFAGDEGINHLGQYRVEAMSITEPVNLDECLGRAASVQIQTLAHGMRHFTGVIAEGELLGVSDNKDGLKSWNYRFILRPYLWLAGLRRNQRIFHNQSAPEILAELLTDYPDLKVEPRLANTYEPLEYTVQYRESDLDFICRMCERFGISWHFEHTDGEHLMVLADNADAYPAAPDESRPYRPIKGHHLRPEEHFSRWQAGRKVTTGRVTLTDYNFKTPDAAMMSEQAASHAYSNGTIESFDYPGGYLEQSVGKGVARLRGDQYVAPDGTQSADGDTLSLAPGMLVTLVDHPDTTVVDTSYLVTRIDHHYEGERYRSGGSRSSGEGYQGHFVLHPAKQPFVPRHVTPRATVAGPQTATVVGVDGIDCDEFGRILVRFHWDRDNKYSMRCRVSQSWAGAGWGAMVIPRIGMEVVVEFIEGDPDQPLVTGCVYNGKNPVPYDLPANKTRSTFKTESHPGGGYNELRFEDKAGSEEVFMHAQKDHNTIIENDESHVIGQNRSKTVGKNQSESVGQDKSITIGRNHSESIGQDVNYTVGQNQIETYGKDRVEKVGNILKQTIVTDHLYEAGGHFKGQVAGDYKLDVGASITTNTGKHVLLAFQKFEIAGPGGKITIDASGVKIEAPKIDLIGSVSMGGMGMSQVSTLSLAAKEALPLCEECAKPKEG